MKYKENNSLIVCSSTLGFPSKIQHTESKHFEMGICENTFWAHLTFETHSVLWAVTSLYHVFKVWFADVHRFHGLFWQARISVRPFWLVVYFDAAIWSWKPKSKHRRNVSLLGKSGQTTVPTWSENINLAYCELIRAQVILKGRHSLRFVHEFASVFKDLLLG